MRPARVRHQFYLPEALSARLDQLAAQPGASKSALLTRALTAWLEHGEVDRLELKYGLRFDRQSAALARIEHRVDLVLETLAASIQHDMMLAAHQPAFDEATRAAGRHRFQLLVDLVGQRLARDAATLGRPGTD